MLKMGFSKRETVFRTRPPIPALVMQPLFEDEPAQLFSKINCQKLPA